MKQDSHQKVVEPLLKKKWLRIAAISGGVLVIALLGVAGWLTHGSVSLAYQQKSVSVDAPFEVGLNQHLLQIPLDKIEVHPQAAGVWTHERSLNDGDTLRFTPDKALAADTTYTVSFLDTRRVTGLNVALPEVSFETEMAPGIEKVSFDTDKVLAADAQLHVTLSAKNRGLRDLKLETKPTLPLEMQTTDDTTFIWSAKKLLPQGKKLSVKLIDAASDTVLINRDIKVASAPKLSRAPKETNFGRNDTATLEFSKPMDRESGKIEFSVDGNGVWKDDKTYSYTPKGIKAGKTYSYTIPKGFRSKDGGIITKSQKRTFSTPGHVRVVSVSPLGQELSQKRQTIRVSFNQPVSKKSAESKVTLSRGTVEARSWEGNTLVLTGANFGAQRTVSIMVAPGIQPVFGLASNQAYGGSFTTEIPVKKLDVPMYYQQHAQSCESADLRMALAYKGKHIGSDMEILRRIGYKPRSLDKKKNIWDDPEVQFVGDVNGSQGKGTGWGVYAQPVAKAARSFGRAATAQYGVSAHFVAQNIHKGNPVILWGIWDESATQKSWKTPGGRKISGPIPMHVRLVVGVKGRADQPVGFYIHDPITGPTYWTADYMVYNAQRAGGANMAVAIQ